MRIATIVGARPQFIKVAPVSKALAETGKVEEVLIHTGQHFDPEMSDVFFDELGIAKPDHNLNIHGGGHSVMTGAMMQELEPLLQSLNVDRVLIYGDTNSTLAGALVAAKLHIPVAHVEAGLRSFNRMMPEEINRIVADQLSDLLFTSTDEGTAQLIKEGISRQRIIQVGDVMYDAALMFAEKALARASILKTLDLSPRAYILATVHRAENTDKPKRLKNIVSALEKMTEIIPVVLPLHPRTAQKMKAFNIAFHHVKVIPPAGYLDMISLESNAAVVATDSGGVQKEAFFYKVPCVTLRDETEWVELVDLGWNRLTSPDRGDIADVIRCAIGSIGVDAQPYGDGSASQAIAARLIKN
ncbi:MAG: UDP-N-acetylglucosamine 2-epimerase (non-hydrolyzing) [Mesorhizobium sp.]